MEVAMKTRSFLTAVIVNCLAAATLFAGTALADHRSGNTVVLGGTLALSGRYAELGERHNRSHSLYVDELNARGGLLGHKVERIVRDDKSDRPTAIKLYEKLITEDKVDLILGPYSSAITDAVANVMEAYKRPFVGSGGASKAIWSRGRKYVFGPPRTIAQDYQHGALEIAKELGINRVAVIGEGSLFPRQSTEGTLEWAKNLGIEVVLLQSYHKDEKDFTALLERIKASGAEAIFSNSYFADAVAQVRQMRKLDINPKMFAATIGPALPRFVVELEGTAEYVLGFSPWEPNPILKHSGMNEFIANYEKRYGVKPNYHAALAYSEMQIIEAAVKDAGSFDPQEVRNSLASIKVATVMGEYKADPQGLSARKGLTFQIQGGKRMIVWPRHIAEAEYILPMPQWAER
jgi:branched-chain amino acid transport system substrate-binding protein